MLGDSILCTCFSPQGQIINSSLTKPTPSLNPIPNHYPIPNPKTHPVLKPNPTPNPETLPA